MQQRRVCLHCWRGDADFTGTAGELRVTADLEIEVQTEFDSHRTAADFIL